MNINEITFEVKAIEGTELFEYSFSNVPDYETVTFYMDEDVEATTLDELLEGLSIIHKTYFRSMSGVYNTPYGILMINGDYNLGNYEALLEFVEMYNESE